MLGAIIGDVIGSVFEKSMLKTTDFDLFAEDSHFTDDTVLTIAVADCLLNHKNYVERYQYYGRLYPNVGFSRSFRQWLFSDNPQPYFAQSNGSAMRVSAVGFLKNSLAEVLAEAQASAEVSHNHPEGIKGAQAVATAVFLARTGKPKAEIRDFVSQTFGYDLSRSIAQIRPMYQFDVSCAGSVPEAILAFLDSDDFESAVRLAISLGGDSDTLAAIAGAIAQAYYQQIPASIIVETKKRLPDAFLQILHQFEECSSNLTNC
ncbi:MAG: ADP-ribosylglycohydrolase family protein [Microscillaceae bacterium]|jgi:ADP-ribosylglycohydrolase|nr:ADP-ribosylglycohydrolase family protein [Microscillaceae bacterium]